MNIFKSSPITHVAALVLCGVVTLTAVDTLALAGKGGSGGKGAAAAQAAARGGGGGRSSAQAAPRSGGSSGARSAAPAARRSAPAPQRSTAKAAPAPRSGSAARPSPSPQRPSLSDSSTSQRVREQAAARAAQQVRASEQASARPRAAEAAAKSRAPRQSESIAQIPNVNRSGGAERSRANESMVILPTQRNERSAAPNVNSSADRKPTIQTGSGRSDRDAVKARPSPSLAKPGRDAIKNGIKPNAPRGRNNNPTMVNEAPNVNRADDRTRSQDRPGADRAAVDPLNKPTRGVNDDVIQGFTPGKLQGRDDGERGSVTRAERNSLDSRRGDPEIVSGMRDRDVRDRNAVARERVHSGEKFVNSSSSSCGHSFCGGHGGCVLSHGHHGHGHHGHHDHHGFSFSFGYFGSSWGLGFGYNDWYYAPSYCYDWPYYYRPYYYGSYYPRYTYAVGYSYPAYPSYPWLYDDDSYEDGYDSGFASGYEAGMDGDVGAHEPTWLAGGSSSGSGASYETPAGQSGWDLLLVGDAASARRAFDRETVHAPGDGLPQIGQAITAGVLERFQEAVATMRKALRDDPDAINEVPQNPQIADQIRMLLTHYRNITRERPEDIDALFMTAALRYLLREDALAYFAIDKAIDAGDGDDSARMLQSVIQRSLDAQPDTTAPVPSGTSPAAPEPASSSPGDRQF